MSSRPPGPQGPLCLTSRISICSPDESVIVTARPCDKHEDKFVPQSCAAQEKVLGGPS